MNYLLGSLLSMFSACLCLTRYTHSVVSSAIMILLHELENATESFFTTLSRTTWSTVSLVSGQSAYVDDLLRTIENVTATAKPLIEQKRYLRNFLDKASG